MPYPRLARALALGASLATVAGLSALGAAPALAATTGTIDATVTVPSATALANVAAVLVEANGSADTGVTVSGPSDVSGTSEQFTFTNVPASASYYVYFYDGTAADNLAPSFDGAATLAAATPVTMPAAGGTVSAAGATMAAGGEISGAVTDLTNGAALTGGTVTAIATQATSNGGFLTDGAGTFTASGNSYTITGLPAGTYLLHYSKTSTSPAYPKVYYAAGGVTQLEADAGTVTVSSGGAAQTANFAIPEAGTISGTVVSSATDSPLAGVVVQFYASTGQPVVRTTTGAQGTYSEAGLLPGAYKIAFTQTNPALPLASQYYTGAASLATATAVTVAANGTMPNINVALDTGGAITGTVTAARGEAPLSNVGVFAMDAAGNVVATAATAGNGTYTVPNLPAGTYYVELGAPSLTALATLDDYGTASLDYAPEFYGATPSLSGAAAVTVKDGAVTGDINGVLLPAGATKVGLPTESRGTLSGLAKNKATFAFTIAPGSGESADLSSVAAKLPAGFGWNRKALAKDLSLNGAKFTYKVSGRTLTVSFQPGQRRFRLSVKAGGVTVSKTLRSKAKRRKLASVTVALTLRTSQGIATDLEVVVKRPA